MADDAEMRNEYDFSKGKRGRNAGRFVSLARVVALDPDVAEVFPDSQSVNEALRVLARVAREQAHKAPAS